ncbi:MAG: type 1 glutamine amidotransferase [Planctomycetota bacterium]|jgi:type 1 glutamine amidotransferase
MILNLALLSLSAAPDLLNQPPLQSGAGADASSSAIEVLLISGENNHDWEWTTPSLVEILEQSGRFHVEVTTTPATTLADAEALKSFDVFLLDYNGPRWGEVAEANFLASVQAGTGVSVVHAANNAFEGWTEYETLVGLCWRKDSSPAERHTGHGKFHTFDVEIVDREHPLTATLPTLFEHPDELYHWLVPMHDAQNRVLARAFSDPETGGTGEQEPMIVVQSFGEGRIFHTPLGHVWRGVEASRASHMDPQFRSLVIRGTEWAATGAVRDGAPLANHLNQLEQDSGWQLLFDGKTTDGWRGYGREDVQEGWSIQSGCLVRSEHAGDLITTETFEDFELEFEWKVAAGTNSGVKYRVHETEERAAPSGPEYQVLDDSRHPTAAPGTRAGDLYAVVAGKGSRLELPGFFNHSRIVANGDRLEHWLNGRQVLSADMSSESWAEHIAASKFTGIEDFGRGAGHICLQDHGGEVWFRSIRIRELPGEGEQLALFEDGLDGWTSIGDAVYEAGDNQIHGEVGGGGQSFLITDRSFGDFVMEVDVLTEERGNSGIQIRSHRKESGRVFGYQVEIDPSERAWSGGLFDEARRAWLSSLEHKETARAAFQHGEWNHFRVECLGPWIRVSVDGISTVDYLDPLDVEGFIGLQVHSGHNTKVNWRNMSLLDLGERSWSPIFDGKSLAGWKGNLGDWHVSEGALIGTQPDMLSSERSFEDMCLRMRFKEEGGRFSVVFRHQALVMPQGSQRAEGVFSSDSMWMLHPAAMPGFEAGQWNDLAISAYGKRVAIHLNGKLVSDLANAPGPLSGTVILALGAAEGQRLEVESIELLGAPE